MPGTLFLVDIKGAAIMTISARGLSASPCGSDLVTMHGASAVAANRRLSTDAVESKPLKFKRAHSAENLLVALWQEPFQVKWCQNTFEIWETMMPFCERHLFSELECLGKLHGLQCHHGAGVALWSESIPELRGFWQLSWLLVSTKWT